VIDGGERGSLPSGAMRGSSCFAFALAVCAGGCLGDNLGGPPPADLVGAWRYLPKQSIGDVPVEDRQVVVFTADGDYEIRGSRGVETGRVEVRGRELTITPDGGAWITTQFFATPDRMLIDALFPVGAVSGSVGTWRGEQSAAAGSSTVTLVLGDAGDARFAQTGPGAEDLVGTWVHVGDDVVFSFVSPAGISRTKHLQELPGQAVGEWLYERLGDERP
jgi:hypothetical protein